MRPIRMHNIPAMVMSLAGLYGVGRHRALCLLSARSLFRAFSANAAFPVGGMIRVSTCYTSASPNNGAGAIFLLSRYFGVLGRKAGATYGKPELQLSPILEENAIQVLVLDQQTRNAKGRGLYKGAVQDTAALQRAPSGFAHWKGSIQ